MIYLVDQVCEIRDFFFSIYLTDISCFHLTKMFRKFQNSLKRDLLKGGLDGYSYFHEFSVILFSNRNHPWGIEISETKIILLILWRSSEKFCYNFRIKFIMSSPTFEGRHIVFVLSVCPSHSLSAQLL